MYCNIFNIYNRILKFCVVILLSGNSFLINVSTSCASSPNSSVIIAFLSICNHSASPRLRDTQQINVLKGLVISEVKNKVDITLAYSCTPEDITLTTLRILAKYKDTCLKPPGFLGFVGPEDISLLPSVQKVTSVFNITHITATAPFLENEESNIYDDKTVFLNQPNQELIAKVVLSTLLELQWFDVTLMHSSEPEVLHQAQFLVNHGNSHGFCFVLSSGTAPKENRKHLWKSVPVVMLLGSKSDLRQVTEAVKQVSTNASLLVYSSTIDTAPNAKMAEDIGIQRTVVWIQAVSDNSLNISSDPTSDLDQSINQLVQSVQMYAKARKEFIACKKWEEEEDCLDWLELLKNVVLKNYPRDVYYSFLVYVKLPLENDFEKVVEFTATQIDSIDDIQVKLRNLTQDLDSLQENNQTSLDLNEDQCVSSFSMEAGPPKDISYSPTPEEESFYQLVGIISGSAFAMIFVVLLCAYILYRQLQERPKNLPSRNTSRSSCSTQSS